MGHNPPPPHPFVRKQCPTACWVEDLFLRTAAVLGRMHYALTLSALYGGGHSKASGRLAIDVR